VLRKRFSHSHPVFDAGSTVHNAGGVWVLRPMLLGCICGVWLFRTLQLSSNRINGTLPAVLGSRTALAALDLSTNALSGSIPASLSSLRGLK
jgi:hypothetical protein